MSWGSAGFLKMLGTSQEDLDRRQRKADERRAWRLAHYGAPRAFEWTDVSDSEDGALITPPESPRGDGPDLSTKAWMNRFWGDIQRGIEPRDTGFGDYETWKAHVLSGNTSNVVPTSAPLPKPGVCNKRRRRPATTISER